MASTYPGTLDALATNRTDATAMATTHALDHNNENDAINKIEAGTVVEFTAATAVALTVPTNANIAFPIGSIVGILQYGAGQVTVSGAGVTFRSAGAKLKTTAQYSSAWLRKRATNEWVLSGDLAV